MYESPQFLTPDGYRRTAINPKPINVKEQNSTKSVILSQKKALMMLKKKALLKKQQKGISPEAAKLIALALKGMLDT